MKHFLSSQDRALVEYAEDLLDELLYEPRRRGQKELAVVDEGWDVLHAFADARVNVASNSRQQFLN